MIRWEWSPPQILPPVDIQQIDPKKLDAIRRQWRQRSLLLDKDKTKPTEPLTQEEKEKLKDARYFSDRDIRVEKEQRARESNVIPKPHSQGKSHPRSKSTPRKSLPLSHLALPFNLDRKPQESRSGSSAPASLGGDQAIDDPHLPVGGENLLNAQESIFYSFYARLYETIGPLWQRRTREAILQSPVPPGEYVTVVDVVLDPRGDLIEIIFLQRSGLEAFDKSVIDTWHEVRQFPNPPKGLLDREQRVHMAWKFTVNIDPRFGLNYLPPQRSRAFP